MDQLVSHETAVLAKSKGFIEPTFNFYFENYMAGEEWVLIDYIGPGQLGDISTEENHNSGGWTLNRISAPTQTALQKYLREIHKIIVWVEPDYDFGDERILLNKWGAVVTRGLFSNTTETSYCETYEEALELGLQMGLNAIKNGKASN